MPHTPRSPAPDRSPPAAAASSVTGSTAAATHLNRALHDILLTRWRTCQRTRAYITQRRAEGKTDPEIRRCLKRYIARELHRHLTRELTP